MCKKNQACTGVESRNIIFIYTATIISERAPLKKKIRLVRELNHGISSLYTQQQSSARELHLKKNQACAGVESRNIIFMNTAITISERTLRKKKN